MTLIEYIRELIKTCPLLEGDRINVDFLDAEHGAYSVNTSPASPIVRKYVWGSLRQFVFTFTSNYWYGAEIRQNLDNVGFFQSFTEWLENVELPEGLPSDQEPVQMEVLSSGYAFMTDEDAGRYQIECRLVYKQKGY